jgi:hypothetical protein
MTKRSIRPAGRRAALGAAAASALVAAAVPAHAAVHIAAPAPALTLRLFAAAPVSRSPGACGYSGSALGAELLVLSADA